jgi:VWFA-related protein
LIKVACWSRFPAVVLLALVAAFVSAQLGPSSAQVQSQPPQVYRAAVDLIVSDVTVVGRDDVPVEGLTAADFAVTVDGSPRRVVTLTQLRAAAPGTPAALAVAGAQPGAPVASGGRTLFIALDRERIVSSQGRSHLEAAAQFVDGLGPDDRVGLWFLPNPHPVKDREELKRALLTAVGTLERRTRSRTEHFSVPLADTLQILEHVINALALLDGTKHLVLITGGNSVPQDDIPAVMRLGRIAASARVHLHAIQIWGVFEPVRTDLDSRTMEMQRVQPVDQDSSAEVMLARETGGITVTTQQGPAAFTRLARELSTWYVIGVEPLPGDRDGKPHRLSVSVPQVQGVTVRARQTFTIPRAGG